jgi:hypothetical protein
MLSCPPTIASVETVADKGNPLYRFDDPGVSETYLEIEAVVRAGEHPFAIANRQEGAIMRHSKSISA